MPYTPAQLEEALYHATDIAGRALLPFILLGETAHDIKYHGAFNANTVGIELGANSRYYTAEALSTLSTLAKGVDISYGMHDFWLDKAGFRWTYHGVPILLRMIDRKYAFFQNPDFTWYKAEEYKVPNPFDKYWAVRHLIQ